MVHKEHITLGDLFLSSREKGYSGLPILSVTLNNGVVNRETIDRRTETNIEPDSHLLVKKGYIAYNMMRVWQGALGRVHHKGLVSPAYVVLKPTSLIDTAYAEYLFKSPRLIYLFWAYSYGITKDRLRLYFNDFSKISINIPPISEQRKIAQILSTWDKAISTTESLIANSQQQKKSLMQQLLTGKKRFAGFEEKWEEKTLAEIAIYRRGSFPQPYGNPEWVDEVNGYPFVQVYDIGKNMRLKPDTKIKISDAAIGKSVFIPKETIIVSIQGSIGRVAITQYDAYVDRTILLFQEYRLPMDKVFFAYSLQELFEIEKTKAPGGTIKTITKQVLSHFTIKIPFITEQQKIASVLTSADQEIETLQQKLSHLKQEKKALMQQLLTGKRRVML